MTQVSSNQVSTSLLDAARTTGAAQSAAETEATRAARKAEETAGVRPAHGLSTGSGAGAVNYSSASLEGIDWEALANDVSTTDTMSITLSEIMVLLVKTMADMRKGQRDAWMADAQNALAMGLNAADRMRESAAAKLACDCVSNGAAIITAGMQVAAQGATAIKQGMVNNRVNSAALLQKQTQAAALGLKLDDVAPAGAKPNVVVKDVAKPADLKMAKVGDGAGSLDQVASEGGMVWKDNPMYVKPDDAISMAEGKPAAVSAQGGPAQTLDAPDKPVDAKADVKTDAKAEVKAEVKTETPPENKVQTKSHTKVEPDKGQSAEDLADKKNELMLKNQKTDRWATQEKAGQMQGWNTKLEAFNKTLDVANLSGKMVGAGMEYLSTVKQAEAQEARSRGEFYSTLANAELDFANELRDSLKGVLDNMKSMEASRHQAMQGIYNI